MPVVQRIEHPASGGTVGGICPRSSVGLERDVADVEVEGSNPFEGTKMIFTTYILKSKMNGSYYVGSAEDVDVRIKKHNSGQVNSTKRYKPWELVHKETFATRKEARRRELQIKSYKSGEAFKKLLRFGGFA